jgi:hypothetical protein
MMDRFDNTKTKLGMDRGRKHIDRAGDGHDTQTHGQSWGWTGFAYTWT